MKTVGFLFLTSLFFVVLTRRVASLRPGGRNVRTRYVTTSVRLSNSIKVKVYTTKQSCTKTCTWSCCICRRCSYRRVWREVPRTYTYYQTRYKPIYFCAPGWRASGDECTIPICTGGCAHGGTCISPERCQCRPGWKGSKCRSDINECATNNGGCQHHCTNSLGSYSCYCDPGYTKSGFGNCQDISECQGNHRCQQVCVNRPGNYSCDCFAGYRLDNNSATCSDIDECSQPICQYKCNNTAGSFFCSCPRGYLLTSNKRDCADHDECTTGNHTCQQRCVNHPGGYTCTCHTGFSLNNDNQTCSDIDECQSGFAGCAYQCNNTIGSFRCICRPGYYLDSDNRTCSDYDECYDGQHTCSQLCGNTPGSYYCTCRPGYYLDGDFRTCKGYPCSSITNPPYGYMNCTGKTMDSVCQFSCQPGYELVGSQLRMCLTRGQWSGNPVFCTKKHCSRPKPPANGFVQIPCSTTYNGKCSFGCSPGYFLNGSRTVLCSADSKWVPIPGQCDAITVCEPNPCYNGGVCHPFNRTTFWCNCTNTAHMGSKCQVGIFRTPKYPRLEQNNSLNVTFELSPPKKELIITPSASALVFHPRNLVITPVKLERGTLYLANMTITSRLPGIHLITYTLSGLAAKSYQAVLPDTVIVLANGTSCNETSLTSFPVGCYKIRLLKCPKGGSVLYARSTESWKISQRRASTKGLASILYGNLTVPLGIHGATLDKLSHSSVSTEKEECQTQSPINVQCLSSDTLASVFFRSLNDSFPSWLRLIPLKTLSSFEPNDVITYIWTGKELKGILKGLGLSVKDESYYSVLLYEGAITVKVNQSSLNLPKYGKNSFLLVAVELCSQPLPANVLLAFNPLSFGALQNMPVYRQLATQGWNISALAMQFSRHSLIRGNMEFYGRVGKSIGGIDPIRSLSVLLVGNFMSETTDSKIVWINNHNSWTAGLRGQVTVSLTLLFLQQQKTLDIPLDRCSGQVQYQDSKTVGSCKGKDTYQLFLNGMLRKDPFTSTLLGSFMESANGKVTFFANIYSSSNSSSKDLSRSAMQVGFHLIGTVKFGPLKFPNMSINTEMYSEDLKECYSDKKVSGLKLSATFNQRKALGPFFTSANSDSLKLLLPSYSQNNSYGILNTTVALLGDSFQAQVEISNTSIRFEQDINLLHTYRLSLYALSRLQPWDFLLLKVSGLFGRSEPNGRHDALEDSLKEMINGYITIVAKNTVIRLRSLQTAADRIKARITKSNFRLVQAENRTHMAVTRYLWALKAQQAALREVNDAEKNVSNSNQEVNQLKASLERLCSVIECPYVCLTGTACNTCYRDLISRERGLCPATCDSILQERIPPFEKTGKCLEQKCELSAGSTNVLGIKIPSSVTCSLEKVGKSVLTTAAKAVVTYGLVSVGVPPNVAYPIASGVVTYATTGDPRKAAGSAAIAGGMQFVQPYIDDVKEEFFGPSDPDDTDTGIGGGLVNAYKGCNDEGEWDCGEEPYPCRMEVFNYKFTNMPYSCEISCEVNVIKETVATPCCKEVNCASRIRDLKCKEKNAFCRIAREKALAKLSAAKRNRLQPLIKLQKAKKKLKVVEIELAKHKIKLEAASSERNTLRRANNDLMEAANISGRTSEENRALIQDAVALAQLWNSTNETCPVDINEISFDVTLSSPSETSIPVLFKIAHKDREKEIFTIVDFSSLNESLQQTAKKIVKELFGNVSVVLRSAHPLNQVASTQSKARRKRAIDEGHSDVTTLVEFKRKCALVTNYQHALGDIIGLLYKISIESLLNLNILKNHTTEYAHAGAQDFAVNVTQADELGLTNKDVDDSKKAVSSDEEVASTASLIELRNDTNHIKVDTAMEVLYRDWEASMETVFNCTSLECSGFVDCMEDFVDNFYYLYQGVDIPEAIPFRKKIKRLGIEVKELFSLEDVSVAKAAEKSYRILQMLSETKDEKIFCAVPPNITNHPVTMKDVKLGHPLELHCKATGDPAPSYRWRKNGELLPQSNTENLRIEKVTTNDSGNYTCEAYNHVSVESSTPAHVLVHSPPKLVYEPPRKLNIPISTGFYLRCNATSVARPLRYQWLFMPSGGDGYSLVPNGNFSVLKFGYLQKHEEGFYKCNVSNPFDYTLSQGVQILVLGFSLVVPSLGLSFEMTGDTKRLDSYDKKTKKANNGGTPHHVNQNFQHDVELSFTRILNKLVNLSSNAVQNLTIEDCKAKNHSNNVTCSVSFRLRGLNVTGPESMNRTERENAISVVESVKQLKQSVAVLVNVTSTRGIIINVKDVNLKVDPASWRAGEYRSLCPTGTVLYVNNFVCVNCPPGSHGALNGTLPSCFQCPVGTYQPNEGQTSCIPCPFGFNSYRKGLEKLSSCKETTTTTTTTTTTSPPKQSSHTFQSTEDVVTETTTKENVERRPTESPDALSFVNNEDAATKWKMAFGVCVAIMFILLAGVVAYALNYRIRKIRHFNTTKKTKQGNHQTFQNPIYDATEAVVKQESLYSHENPVYKTEDLDQE